MYMLSLFFSILVSLRCFFYKKFDQSINFLVLLLILLIGVINIFVQDTVGPDIKTYNDMVVLLKSGDFDKQFINLEFFYKYFIKFIYSLFGSNTTYILCLINFTLLVLVLLRYKKSIITQNIVLSFIGIISLFNGLRYGLAILLFCLFYQEKKFTFNILLCIFLMLVHSNLVLILFIFLLFNLNFNYIKLDLYKFLFITLFSLLFISIQYDLIMTKIVLYFDYTSSFTAVLALFVVYLVSLICIRKFLRPEILLFLFFIGFLNVLLGLHSYLSLRIFATLTFAILFIYSRYEYISNNRYSTTGFSLINTKDQFGTIL
jgi:hypothetical protein